MEIEDSPLKVSPKKNGNGIPKINRKAKRTVKKRFETEDGYMRTETVIEEYTASEDENDENEKRNQTSEKKQTKSESTTQKKSIKSESSTEKKAKAAAATNKIKQGSIMNFFTKK